MEDLSFRFSRYRGSFATRHSEAPDFVHLPSADDALSFAVFGGIMGSILSGVGFLVFVVIVAFRLGGYFYHGSKSSVPPQYHPNVAVPPTVAEEKPPVAQSTEGTPLSGSQVRYCLSQRIRIQGAAKAANPASAELERFLALFDDYNLRCGNYRSAPGLMLSSVRQEVEARRAALELEGLALIRTPAAGTR